MNKTRLASPAPGQPKQQFAAYIFSGNSAILLLRTALLILLLTTLGGTANAALRNWVGGTSSDWNVASNWNPAVVPAAGDSVVIWPTPAQNMPVINSGTTARAANVYIAFFRSLTIQAGGVLELDGAGFYGLANIGAFTNNGTLRVKRAGFHCIDNTGTVTNNGLMELGTATATPYTCQEEGIRQASSGVFVNNSSGQIVIQRAGNNGILNFSGTPSFTNHGAITVRESGMNPSTAETADGIDVRAGSFINETTGTILISKIMANGFYCRASGSTTNKGLLTIRNVGLTAAEEVKEGISNNTTFTNTATGQIHIDSTGNNGIFSQGVFTNSGQINIGLLAANSIAGNGIANIAEFNNETGATIQIKNTLRTGLVNITFGGIFTNKSGAEIAINNTGEHGVLVGGLGALDNRGTLQIGNTGPIGDKGLLNNATFFNQPGATLSIQQAVSDGIRCVKSLDFVPVDFRNAGQISIGNTGSAGSNIPGINVFADCMFQNLFCGVITTYQKIINAGTFQNDAFINTPGNTAHSNSGSFVNDGLIEDPNGLFNAVTLTNNDFIVTAKTGECTMSNVLKKGSGLNVTISSTWYKMPNLTQAAGTYNQAGNTFTVTDLSFGTHTLYFSATDVATGCAKTIPVQITLSDLTPPTALCNNTTVILNSAGNGAITTDVINNGSNDICGIASLSLSKTNFNCSNTGMNTVTLTVTDNAGNTNTCTATVTVVDNINPTITCPATQTLVLNSSCQAGLPDYRSLAATGDNCGVQGTTQSPAPGTTVSNAGNMTVTLTVTDINGNSTQCSFTVTKVDNTPPAITCPATQTLVLNSSCQAGLPDYRSLAATGDNCGVQGVAQSPAPGTTVSNAGNMTVTLTVTDINSNSTQCSFTVTKVDNTPPTVVCFPQTLTFNGQQSFVLHTDDLVDADDNCGVATITLSPNAISCEQLGQMVPVTVTVTDINNNPATCTSNITVTGLPCGWSQNPDGVNCANGNNIAYNPGTGVWTATSTNCFYGPPFTGDATAFAQRTLCGDGSITVQVTGITGNALGWAGVVMRESNAAGAKKAQLTTNMAGNQSRREFRLTTNGAANPQQFPSQNRYWLRIVRAGNQFTMFTSPNGSAWYLVAAQNIEMNSCIQMGLVATNYNANSTVTATFANVSFSGGSAVVAEGIVHRAESIEEPHGFEAYPNPTSGELNVDLGQYLGRAVRVELYSLTGQLLRLVEIEEVQTVIEQLDLSDFRSGMYMVKVKSRELPDVTRRVVIAR